MKSFLQKVGSNRILRAQTLTVSFIKPWDSLAETHLAVRSTADRLEGELQRTSLEVSPADYEVAFRRAWTQRSKRYAFSGNLRFMP